jgi:exopolysaccharide biosynthesis polyprenyl glycosylphosphotransferase
MTLRTPWLRDRKQLILLAILDFFAIFIIYFSIYYWRIGAFPGLTKALLAVEFIWLSGSYFLGRYTQKVSTAHALKRVLILAFVLLGLFVVQAWFVGIVDTGTRLRSFLLPLIIGIAVSSSFIQLFLAGRSVDKEKVVLICAPHEQAVLESEISCLPPRRRSLMTLLNDRDHLSFVDDLESRDMSVAVSFQARIPEEYLERLVALRPLGVRVGSLVDWTEASLQRVPPELLSDRWLLAAEGFALQPGRWSWRLKRVFDIFGALSLLFLSSPFLLAGALAIWVEDRGPIFYSQIRSGLYGNPIRIWKLRSMRVDAEALGIQWATKADPRITRSGSLLRQLRIDELPQLWGVVRGELSLIGPRPERPEFEIDLEKQIPHYRVRHWIRPGLSGWAQVNYPYGNSVADSRMKLSYDLYYLRNAGILLDLLVLLKTIRLILRREGFQPKR